MTNVSPIRIHTLGEFKLFIDTEDHTSLLRYDKAKLLLALLALQKQPMSRTLLAEMLWPDSDENKGRTRVRHALHSLRQAFGPYSDILHTTQSEISLTTELVFVDLLDFIDSKKNQNIDQVKQNLDLYSTGFLQSLKPPASESFINWFQNWQSRHELELAQQRHFLINYYQEQNDTHSALTYAKWWLCQTPDDEICHRYLIRLLLSIGDQEAALRAYQYCEKTIKERYGVLPSAETQALLQQPITALAQTPSVKPSTAPLSLLPLATLAISLSPALHADINLHKTTETSLENLAKNYEHIQQLCVEYGASINQNDATTLLAHFGYPTVLERPIDQALALALQIQRIQSKEGLQIRQVIHACTTTIPESTQLNFNLDAITAPHVLPLVWKGQHGEIIVNMQAAARITDYPLERIQSADQVLFKLNIKADSQKTPTSRMFGRIRYFDTLIQKWAHHRPGHPPTFIQLQGRAGLGKSQLAQVIADYVHNVEGRVLTFRCIESQQHEPFHALKNWLLQSINLYKQPGITQRESIQSQALYSALATQHQISALTSQQLVNTLFFQSYENNGDDHKIHEHVLSYLKEYQLGQAPLCIIWDNLQWIDPSSLLLLHKICQSQTSNIALVIGMSRYKTDYTWPATPLQLLPLDIPTIIDYLNQRSKSSKILPEVKQFIIQSKIDNPRYINDVLHLANLDLPYQELPRLIDLLAARLHQLTPCCQQVLFLGALLPTLTTNNIFSILYIAPQEAQQHLNQLIDQGLFSHEAESVASCLPLTKIALLRLISPTVKRNLCRKIALFFIDQEKPAAAIAHYLHDAQSPDTILWWQKAVQEALDKGETDAAIDYLSQALNSQAYIPDHSLRNSYSFENHTTLGSLAVATQGPAAHDVVTAYQEAAKSSEYENTLQSCAIFWGQWVAQYGAGNFSASLVAAQRLEQTATQAKHEIWQGWSFYAQAQYHLWKGCPNIAETQLLQCITTINLANHQEPTPGFFGSHSYALAYGALGLTQGLMGRYSPALQNTRHAIHLAEQNKEPLSIIACRLHLLRIYYLTNNLKALKQDSELILSFMPPESHDNVWFAFILSYKCIANHLLSPNAATLEQLENTRHSIETNMPAALDGYLCTLARCYIASNEPEKALSILDEALSIGEARESVLVRPEIHCLRGDAWAALQKVELAHVEWYKAKKISMEQQLLVYVDWTNERLPPEESTS